jgi:FkbM family methyltransferase
LAIKSGVAVPPHITRFTYKQYDYVFEHNEADHIYRCQQKTFYELPLLEYIASLKLSGTYIDVGAHIGNHAVFFATQCPSRRVYALESNPPSYDKLLINVAANQAHVDCRNLAALDRECRVEIRKSSAPFANTGMASVMAVLRGGYVYAKPLDFFADFRIPPVALIKLDIEGSEAPALLGAQRLIKLYYPLLAVEAQTEADRAAHAAILEPLGYQVIKTFGATPLHVWKHLP